MNFRPWRLQKSIKHLSLLERFGRQCFKSNRCLARKNYTQHVHDIQKKHNMKQKLILIFIMYLNFGNAQTILYSFGTSPDGHGPYANLYYDGTYLYGTTDFGGGGSSNYLGTIFKIKPDGSAYQQLHAFAGYPSDGQNPMGSLVSDGTFLYGMTINGGGNGIGTIFKIMPDGSGYAKMMDFDSISGYKPYASLMFDGNYLYGTTGFGGLYGKGVVFKIKTDGSGYTKILNFQGNPDGANPTGSLISDGTYLYGTTSAGGFSSNPYCGSFGCGTLFKIKPDGSGYVKIYDFLGHSVDGESPIKDLLFDGTFLYGLTFSGGTNHKGSIFKIMPDGSAYTKLFDFDGHTGTASGSQPYGSLISDGTYLYGTCEYGGSLNPSCMGQSCGTLFKIKLDGSGFTKLVTFNGNNGSNPKSSLVSDGTFFYGTTSRGGLNNGGTIFKFPTSSVGLETLDNIDLQISIFPNPSNGIININSNSIDKQIIDVFDINGRLVINDSLINSTSINGNNLDNGIYTVTIKNKLGTTHKKLVITH